jgi:hypothetical protein
MIFALCGSGRRYIIFFGSSTKPTRSFNILNSPLDAFAVKTSKYSKFDVH